VSIDGLGWESLVTDLFHIFVVPFLFITVAMCRWMLFHELSDDPLKESLVKDLFHVLCGTICVHYSCHVKKNIVPRVIRCLRMRESCYRPFSYFCGAIFVHYSCHVQMNDRFGWKSLVTDLFHVLVAPFLFLIQYLTCAEECCFMSSDGFREEYSATDLCRVFFSAILFS
jgi:hypothetical protein